MRDDADAAHTEERGAALLVHIELAQRAGDFSGIEPGDLGDHPDEHGPDALVELEQHVAGEAITDHDIDRPAVAAPVGNVATLDVAEEVESGREETLMGLFDGRVALLRFFPNREQTNGGVVPSE